MFYFPQKLITEIQRKEDDIDSLNNVCDDVSSTCKNFPEMIVDAHDFEKNNEKVNKRYTELKETVEKLVEDATDTKKSYVRYSDDMKHANVVLNQVEEAILYEAPVGMDTEETEKELSRIKVCCLEAKSS